MFESKANFRTPSNTTTVGMWLMLIALAMLFGATMIGYAVIRSRWQDSATFGTVRLPTALWLSTALILAGSVTIHLALQAARRERQLALRRYLLLSSLLAAAFVVVQAPSLLQLLDQHAVFRAHGVGVYGLVFFLILVHALHVLGGIIALAVVTLNAYRGRYDHESHNGVKHAAMYWHFLDAVWLIMFLGMLAMG